jgi:transposase InsO family protein
MRGVIELIPATGEAMVCRSLSTTRGELRRQRLRALAASIMGPPAPRQPRPSPLAPSEAEGQLVLNTLGGERHRQRRHNAYAKPELLATGANQVWSWDITKLKGPANPLVCSC